MAREDFSIPAQVCASCQAVGSIVLQAFPLAPGLFFAIAILDEVAGPILLL